jgi:hypothetical protein
MCFSKIFFVQMLFFPPQVVALILKSVSTERAMEDSVKKRKEKKSVLASSMEAFRVRQRQNKKAF